MIPNIQITLEFPEEFVNSFLGLIFGQNYLLAISMIILFVIFGLAFLVFYFMFRRRNLQYWSELDKTVKIVLSLVLGLLIFLNAGSIWIIFKPLISTNMEAIHSIIILAFLYEYIALALTPLENRDEILDIEKYINTMARTLVVFGGIALILTNPEANFISVISIYVFVLFIKGVPEIIRDIRNRPEIIQNLRRRLSFIIQRSHRIRIQSNNKPDNFYHPFSNRMKRKEIIIGIVIPILTVILSWIGSWLIAYYQVTISKEQSYEVQLLDRIKNTEEIMERCNITNNTVIKYYLLEARYCWSDRNYTFAENFLNKAMDEIESNECLGAWWSWGKWSIVCIVAVVCAVLGYSLWPKTKKRVLRFP